MANQEVDDLRSAQSKKRSIIIGVVATIAIGVGLTGWMMSGSDEVEYSIGTPCTDDCGVYRYDGWICLKKEKYCTRPCGENHDKCAEGFTCKQVDGAPPTVTEANQDQRSTYCLR